ncbi:hypothetical protein B4N89_30645 [Embleya scabrispora]|uniref:Insertion element IS402-like domain-containing protein n=1 Tax=Embleya scabrispora TaxID=159449 RepID=A0A1T3P6I5_9ACTN|nr:hypothetical protein B4N89_30645 [Embleya scabrispora]
MGVHRAVPAGRCVRSVSRVAAAAVRGCDPEVRTGGQWHEVPERFGAWSTVHNRFRQWRDAGVFEALLEGLIAEGAKRGGVDLSLVSVDSTTVRAHHDAAGTRLAPDTLAVLEKAAAEEDKAWQKGRSGGTSRERGWNRPGA